MPLSPPRPQCLLAFTAGDSGTAYTGSVYDHSFDNSLAGLDGTRADEEHSPNFNRIFNWFTQHSGLDFLSCSRDTGLKDVVQAIHACQHRLSDRSRATHLVPELSQRPHAASNDLSLLASAPIELPKSWNESLPSLPRVNKLFSQSPMLDRLCPSDVRFLEDNGCFQVPPNPVLDIFLREYFLYIQPMLPVLHERDFCEAFIDIDGDKTVPNPPSLFVFQAVLAASSMVRPVDACGVLLGPRTMHKFELTRRARQQFVPLGTLSACGFRDHQAARQSLCRRAYLLYDLGWEDDPITITQGALILSLISSNNDMAKGNSFWLMTAVRYATAARPSPGNTHNTAGQDLWTRLWWCCIIRDRLISLGSRRPLHVTLDTFNPVRLPALTLADLESDRDGSLVYDQTTQKHLARFFLRQLQLAIALSKLLTLIYPPGDSVVPQISSFSDYSETLLRIEQCKEDLREWSESARLQSSLKTPLHISLILFDRLLSMSFRTAEIALYSTEFLLSHFYPSYANVLIEIRLRVARETIYEGIMSICEATGDLCARGLETKLDMQGPAYTALPLKVLEVGFQLDTESSESVTLHQCLQTLQTAMKVYKSKWDGIDPVFNHIEVLIPIPSAPPVYESTTDPSLPEAHHSISAVSNSSFKDTWCEFLRQHRALYLQVTTTLNFCIARGERVGRHDLPEQLRPDFFTPASAAIKATRIGSPILRLPQLGTLDEDPWPGIHNMFLYPPIGPGPREEIEHSTMGSRVNPGDQFNGESDASPGPAIDSVFPMELPTLGTLTSWDEFLEHQDNDAEL
ncbi:hypothetical protein AYO21_01514 [Fonsecaea monophora]|uniref:Xylanolytic transcriptional activator regulatory domain-containing protein n=1 Tax=Fonsecaea monophora TaxID=254056 RepID=A0A177FIQ4_9EURO|nr:hypothetical protein AYO21_01514 [Fonsecaea monophora]OAG44057.1 hypothetical protein AYO21_01514 [Fonsecaea monophora]